MREALQSAVCWLLGPLLLAPHSRLSADAPAVLYMLFSIGMTRWYKGCELSKAVVTHKCHHKLIGIGQTVASRNSVYISPIHNNNDPDSVL